MEAHVSKIHLCSGFSEVDEGEDDGEEDDEEGAQQEAHHHPLRLGSIFA